MLFRRRQLLRVLSFGFGSSFLLQRNQLGIAAQQTATKPMTTGAKEMEKVTGIGGLFFGLTIRQRWGFGTSNTWELRSLQQATRQPFGSRRPDQPFSVLSPRRATISVIPKRSGWSTFESGISIKWPPSYKPQESPLRFTPSLIPTADSPACMTLKEIRSNYGNPQNQAALHTSLYSLLSACAGSIEAARRAGINPATDAASASARIDVRSTAASMPLTS
jgi:hypothetical protein